MLSSHVYDKAKYHHDSVSRHNLPEDHAANHTVVFLRWMIEHELMSAFFEHEAADILKRFRAGDTGVHAVYSWWDCCFVDDMLSDEGNAFAKHYFDFQRGQYLSDYIKTLKRGLPTEFHVVYNEENYLAMDAIISRRFDSWKNPKKRWWPF